MKVHQIFGAVLSFLFFIQILVQNINLLVIPWFHDHEHNTQIDLSQEITSVFLVHNVEHDHKNSHEHQSKETKNANENVLADHEHHPDHELTFLEIKDCYRANSSYEPVSPFLNLAHQIALIEFNVFHNSTLESQDDSPHEPHLKWLPSIVIVV